MKVQRVDAKRLLAAQKHYKMLAVGLFLCLILILGFRVSSPTDTFSLLTLEEDSAQSDKTTNSDIHGYKKLKPHEIPSEYPPIHCRSLLEDVQQGRSIQDPNQGKVFSRWTDIPPSFQIAIHNQDFDRPRWSILQWGHYYETALMNAFSVVLNETKRDPNNLPRVLDVGGNIGFFSLQAAAHGHVIIDTFEPNLVNNFRMCQSMELNGWVHEFQEHPGSSQNGARINCNPYGIGKEIGSLVFQESWNPGQGKFQENDNDGEGSGRKIPVITLDAFAESRGWFESQPHIAIFKLDTEGFEINVIKGAKRLLNSGMIKNIFMEVSARSKVEIEESRFCLGLIASAGYDVHQYGGFRGPKHTVDWSGQDVTNLTELVIHEVTKKKHPQLNLWWRLTRK